MPYKNIIFVKLEKRLLDDARWYMLSESAQLNYVKLLLLAAATYNQIPTNFVAIKRAFKTNQKVTTIEKTLIEIEQTFTKFHKKKINGIEYYCFNGFEEKTNYLPEQVKLRKSQGLPKLGVDIDIDKDKEKEERREGIITHWNSFDRLPKVIALSESRMKRMNELLEKPHFREHYKEAIRKLSESSFATGANPRNWKATLDWFLDNDLNYVKAVEGNYDNKVDPLAAIRRER